MNVIKSIKLIELVKLINKLMKVESKNTYHVKERDGKDLKSRIWRVKSRFPTHTRTAAAPAGGWHVEKPQVIKPVRKPELPWGV